MNAEAEAQSQEKALREIDLLIKKVSNSTSDFRESVREIIFIRLHRFFERRNKQAKWDTELKLLLGDNVAESEWDELRELGLKIPMLERAKSFEKISIGYCIAALIVLVILTIRNLDLLFVVWGLPIFGGAILIVLSPLLLLMKFFKRRHLPSETIDEFIELIISANWTDLVADDKRLFKMLVREEEEWKKRISANIKDTACPGL